MSEIIFNVSPSTNSAESQIENFQTTLASLNQQVIILREALQEKDQEIAELEIRLVQNNAVVQQSNASLSCQKDLKQDKTLSIVGLLLKLYEFIAMPGKDKGSY